MWMKGIYNFDLNTSEYETGFNTDLHGLADQIMALKLSPIASLVQYQYTSNFLSL